MLDELQPICDTMRQEGRKVDADTLTIYVQECYPSLWVQLGDYPYGAIALWLVTHPQPQEEEG